MKTDLATSIVAAIISVIIAYFVCGLFLPELTEVSFKVLKSDKNYSLTEPNTEIFNYRAIDPAVEVYVGQCDEYDSNGNCVRASSAETPEENQEGNQEETPEKTPSEDNQNGATD